MKLTYTDHRVDPAAWARSLGVSDEAIALYTSSEVIDLHIDSFIWTRVFGYDLTARHGRGLLGASFYSQVDLPRVREAQIGGGVWIITTNPLRSAASRRRAFNRNLTRLREILGGCGDDVALVTTLGEYRAARATGKHAAFVGIQGGNALDAPDWLDDLPPGQVLRITLVHLTSSGIGRSSAPTSGSGGLTERGHEYVRRLDAAKIFVDLAHINRAGFFDAVAAHDRTLPLMVSHTGIGGVHPHWRNLDDEQIRAVADTGGIIGVIYQSTFLGDGLFSGRAESIVEHLSHLIDVGGEDVAALGSDWDGAIVTPRDMPTCLELPRLVQRMLDRGWRAERIRKILGENFLATLGRLRP